MPGDGDARRRRLKPQELVDPRRVERKIETRAHADLQYAALGGGHHSLAIWHETAVSHRQIDEIRQNAIRVEAHGLLPSASAAAATIDAMVASIQMASQR